MKIYKDLQVRDIPKLLQMVKSHSLVFEKKKHEGENVYTYFFKKPKKVSYKAGQHFIVKVPHENPDKGGVRRLFSASSAPSEDCLTFTMRYLGAGGSSYKRALHALKKGQEITVRGPSPIQDFFGDISPQNEYVFVIGGIGITPVRSILSDAVYHERSLKASLLWAHREPVHATALAAEIDKLSKQTLNGIDHIVSPKRIDVKTLKKTHVKYSSPIYIISGTPGFTQGMKDILIKDLQVTESSIKNYSYEGGFGMGKGY